jgi:hypothetical protein
MTPEVNYFRGKYPRGPQGSSGVYVCWIRRDEGPNYTEVNTPKVKWGIYLEGLYLRGHVPRGSKHYMVMVLDMPMIVIARTTDVIVFNKFFPYVFILFF